MTVWRAQDGSHIQTLTATERSIDVLAFSPDGQLLAASGVDFNESGTFDAPVHVWQVDSWDLLYKTAYPGPTVSLEFSPDNTLLATESHDGIYLWDARTGSFLTSLDVDTASINDIAFSPDGRFLAGADASSKVYVWDVAHRTLHTTLQGHTAQVLSVAWHPDGTLLATASGIDGWSQFWGQKLYGVTIRFVSGRSRQEPTFVPSVLIANRLLD